MKMKQSEKDFLLSQVAIVLSKCQSLVSQLSNVQIEEVVNKPDDEDLSSVSSQQSDELLWDVSEDFPVYPTPSEYYNLVYFSESESEPIQISSPKLERKPTPKECPFVMKVKSFLTSGFPSNVYSKEKSNEIRQKWLDDSVFVEFQSMWRHSNVGDLFIQKPEDSIPINTTANPAPEIKYRTVDFSKLNVRNIKNIPRPELYPIHGCSEDPEFYVKTYWAGGFEYEKKGVTYYKSSPHGSVYGYRTNVGIVPVPTTPVYGYVWSDHDGANLSADWVLHAIFPEERSKSRATRPTPRWTTPRRPPGSRRWPT